MRLRVYGASMSRADEYRKLAEEAKRRAEAATESAAKAMYQQLAASWEQLADRADRQSRSQKPPSGG